MTHTAEITRYMDPASQGIVGAIMDDAQAQTFSDDATWDYVRNAIYLNADLDLDWSASTRLAYSLVFPH